MKLSWINGFKISFIILYSISLAKHGIIFVYIPNFPWRFYGVVKRRSGARYDQYATKPFSCCLLVAFGDLMQP